MARPTTACDTSGKGPSDLSSFAYGCRPRRGSLGSLPRRRGRTRGCGVRTRAARAPRRRANPGKSGTSPRRSRRRRRRGPCVTGLAGPARSRSPVPTRRPRRRPRAAKDGWMRSSRCRGWVHPKLAADVRRNEVTLYRVMADANKKCMSPATVFVLCVVCCVCMCVWYFNLRCVVIGVWCSPPRILDLSFVEFF